MLLLLSPFAHANYDYAWNLKCDYVFYQVPFSTVELEVHPDGTLAPAARITMQGASHLESFTAEAPAAGEKLHGWISKESEQNKIELVIYAERTSQGDSKITNHQMPMGQDVWGSCAAN
jgi:hypothetical protein